VPTVKHYLLTFDVGQHTRMYGYLMCNDKRYVGKIIDHMINKAEELGFVPLGIGLVTELSTGTEIVRKKVCDISEEAKHCMEAATDFHFSAWLGPTDDPDDNRLMRLH
jgi:hypothetical protein